MEFGKLSSVDKVNWQLPKDSSLSQKFLAELKPKTHKAQFLLGGPAWAEKTWVGKIYPPKTKSADFLFHYSRNYQCIELNTTHYRIPTVDQVKNWVKQVPSGFLFCPKVPQKISHSRNGMMDKLTLKEWWEVSENFQGFLGPTFLQFPPNFSYDSKALLFKFIQAWPEGIPLCLEFRHPSWFSQEGGEILPALTSFLQGKAMGLVITDTAGKRDVIHTSISADYTFIRFVGNDLHPSDFSRLKDWAKKLDGWQKQGLKKIFFMLHENDYTLIPELTGPATQIFNDICQAHLPPLQMGLSLPKSI